MVTEGSAETTPAMIVLRLAKLIEMALAEHGLTANQYRTLAFIEAGEADLAEMSIRLVMKRPNLTALLDTLGERGLIERHVHATERRRIALRLTPRGAALLQVASSSAEQALRGLAQLGDGAPEAHLDALGMWATAVDAAAVILREVQNRPPSSST